MKWSLGLVSLLISGYRWTWCNFILTVVSKIMSLNVAAVVTALDSQLLRSSYSFRFSFLFCVLSFCVIFVKLQWNELTSHVVQLSFRAEKIEQTDRVETDKQTDSHRQTEFCATKLVGWLLAPSSSSAPLLRIYKYFYWILSTHRIVHPIVFYSSWKLKKTAKKRGWRRGNCWGWRISFFVFFVQLQQIFFPHHRLVSCIICVFFYFFVCLPTTFFSLVFPCSVIQMDALKVDGCPKFDAVSVVIQVKWVLKLLLLLLL